MIITIGGTPGAGKDTVGAKLAEELSYKYYAMGEMRRKMAEERNISLEELNQIGEKEIWTDQEVDDFQEELGMTMDNILVVSRLSFHFIPNAFKIFLKCDYNVASKRIYADRDERESENYDSPEEVLEHLIKRQASDAARYQKYYGIKIDDMGHYDMVLDTTTLNPAQVVELLKKAAEIFMDRIQEEE